MSGLQVEYCRAENGIDLADSNNDEETIVYCRQRNGMSKMEKLLLACVVILVFLCAIFAGLYFSERQHRKLKKAESSSDEKNERKCKGQGEEVNKANETAKACGSNYGRTSCSNKALKKAAVGRVAFDICLNVLVSSVHLSRGLIYKINCMAFSGFFPAFCCLTI